MPAPHAKTRAASAVRAVRVAALCGLLAASACRPDDGAEQRAAEPAPSAPAVAAAPADWPRFRADAGLTGAVEGDFSHRPTLAWTARFKDAIASQPVVAGGIAYVSSKRGVVAAFDLETGEEKWRFGGGFSFLATPLAHRDRLYLGDVSGDFFALDIATGEPVWTFRAEDKIEGAATFVRTQTAAGGERGLVVFGSYDSHLYALDAATGEEVWRYRTDNYINGSPALSRQGRITFGGCDSFVHVVEARTGQGIRRLEGLTYIPGSVPVDGGVAYAGNHEGQILALPLDGSPALWSFSSRPAKPFLASAALTDDTVYAANQNATLYALDRRTGEPRWRHRADSSLDASPVVVGDTVITVSYGGRIDALATATGEPRWTYDLGGRVSGSPAVAADTLLIGDDSGQLTALRFLGRADD